MAPRNITLASVAIVSVMAVTMGCSDPSRTADGIPSDDQYQYVINSDNYVDLVAEVFDIYVGDVYNKPLLQSRNVLSAATPATSSFDEDARVRQRTYDCANGGSGSSLHTEYYQQGRTPYPNPQYRSLSFTDCQQGSRTYQGNVEFTEFGNILMESADLRIYGLDDGSEITFSGEAARQYPQHDYDNLESETWRTDHATIAFTTGGQETQISDMTSYFERGYVLSPGGLTYHIELYGDFTLRTSLTSGHAVDVSTTDSFSTGSDVSGYPATPVDWWFYHGQLMVTAEDGSSLKLEPAVDEEYGNKPTTRDAIVTLQNGDNTLTFTVPWSQWSDNLQFDSIPSDPFGLEMTRLIESDMAALAIVNTSTVSVINRYNYADLIDKVFAIYTGSLYRASLAGWPNGVETGEPNLVSVNDNSYLGKILVSANYQCSNDFGAEHVFNPTSYYGDRGYAEWEFNRYNCGTSGFSFHGYAQQRQWSGAGSTLASRELLITDPQGATIRLSGWMQNRWFGKHTFNQVWRTQDSEIEITLTDQPGSAVDMSVTGMSTYYGWGSASYAPVPPVAMLDGHFTVQASWAGHETLQVQALDSIRLTKAINDNSDGEGPYAFAENYHPITGRLSVTAGDGSSLVLDVNTGDDSTVNIAITDHMGSTEFTDEWSTWANGFE
ncbi:MAG: hypothetical protein HKN43_10310 [Rhodothermales bacterium]|nr:hypothetical protein [Rhodothermales bacterium]